MCPLPSQYLYKPCKAYVYCWKNKYSTCPDWKITCSVGHVITKFYVPWDKIYMPRACGHALMSSPALVVDHLNTLSCVGVCVCVCRIQLISKNLSHFEFFWCQELNVIFQFVHQSKYKEHFLLLFFQNLHLRGVSPFEGGLPYLVRYTDLGSRGYFLV